MQGWRKNSCPRVPKTIQEYVQLLNSQRWRSRFFSNDSNLDVSNIIGTDGSVATVFIDGIMLQNFTNVNLYVDATYKVCPRQPNKKIYQFFTIMASFDDTVLPVAWSFKSHKSMPCYHSVMNRFQQLTPHLQVLSITTDFEVSLRNVLRELYPNAVLKGCYFHHVQALMKKAEKIKLLDVLNDWDDGQDFFRKLITLALLPSH
ncbi:GSCOCG00013412001-RA-CDS [Cotesia congregata]|nr:GSCOCG00013412001-RA-CDS [Cotesia congregata]